MSQPQIALGVENQDMDEAWSRFVARLIRARKSAKLSQRALGEKADMSKSFISNIENKNTNPSLMTILRLAEALEISTSSLFADD